MLQVGSVAAIDEKGTQYEAVCGLGCPHTVTPVTRRPITIVEEKQVRDLFGEGWGNTGPKPATLPAFRAIDTDGTEWLRDWDGWVNEGPGPWKTADGRRAETASMRDPAVQYAGRASDAYTFTDLTTEKDSTPHRPACATGKDIIAQTLVRHWSLPAVMDGNVVWVRCGAEDCDFQSSSVALVGEEGVWAEHAYHVADLLELAGIGDLPGS